MASGTIYLTQSNSSGSYIAGKIVWVSSDDINANNSDVTAGIYVRKGDTTQTLTIPTDGTWSYSITINGKKATGTASKSVLESWVLLGTYTVDNIAHNSDGTKSITISGSVTGPSGTSYSGRTTSGSGTATFDAIPRASILTYVAMSPGELSGTLTYKFTPKSTSFYNRLIIALNINGSLTTIKTVNIGRVSSTSEQSKTTSFASSELSKIYAALPNTANAKIRVILRTYSDSGYSTQVGSETYIELASVPMPASIKPTASLTVSLVNNNTWIKSKNIYVAGYSGLTAEMAASPGTGATLSSCTISGGGYSSNTNQLTVSTLTTAGSLTLTGTAKDSRGRTNSASKTITVLAYSKPKITEFIVERGTFDTTTSKWTPDDDGQDVHVIFTATTSLADKGNTYSAQIIVDGSVKSTTSGCASGSSYDGYFFGFSKEKTYDFALKVTDQVGQYSSALAGVSTMPITIEFNASGQGIAFGKTSEKDAFECQLPAEFNGTVGLTGPYSERNAGIYTEWADSKNHDLLVRGKDGLTVGVGWVGSDTYPTVLELRGKKIKFRGAVGEQSTSTYTYTTGTDTTTSNTNQEVFKIGNLQIITGRVQIPASSYVTVKFKNSFTANPRIFVTDDNAGGSQASGAGYISTTTTRIYNKGSTIGDFFYMAIGFASS